MALAAGAWPVVVAAVLASIIAAFLYVRVIKVMRPHAASDPDLRRRFREEARIATRLKHPNICAIHDVHLGDPATASYGRTRSYRRDYLDAGYARLADEAQVVPGRGRIRVIVGELLEQTLLIRHGSG